MSYFFYPVKVHVSGHWISLFQIVLLIGKQEMAKAPTLSLDIPIALIYKYATDSYAHRKIKAYTSYSVFCLSHIS